MSTEKEMSTEKASRTYKIFVVISFIIMILVNALANVLPINNVTTGQISAFYPNLFTPASYTFAIWGVIYLLLGGYTVYQLDILSKNKDASISESFDLIRIYFIISSFANATWIFSWHYDYIALAMSLMIMLLFCLIMINQIIHTEDLSPLDNIFIKLPFSIYCGWITVATIANATTLLVSLGWNGWGVPESTWAAIIIVLGFVIATIVIIKYKDIAYGLTMIWAYIGILMRHIMVSGFNGRYPGVIYTLILCIVLFCIVEAYVLISKIYKNRNDV